MCDTMVALGTATKDRNVIFAKNSDRQPNEPLLTIRIPRRRYPEGSKVKCTYITIDQAPETYEVLLMKPSWMWGAEMGCNEYGLNIGNEAVFTRVKQGPPSLLGMDMVRLALERCRNSEEALHFIIELLEKYGQGGNCGYEKKFVYHNSFLIADRSSAWVLETAGEFWAAEKVKDVRAISNRLSIGRDFDLAHPDLVKYAVDKGWCPSAEDFNFAECYSNKLFTTFARSKERQTACSLRLERDKGRITVETMLEILRSHHPQFDEGRRFQKNSVASVCMHGGGLVGDHTTGSYVASLGEVIDTYWITAASTPCIAVFKPYWLTDNEVVFSEEQEAEALAFWKLREELHRLVLHNRVDVDAYLRQAKDLEGEYLRRTTALDLGNADPNQLNELMRWAWQQEKELVEKTVAQSRSNAGKIKGNFYFRRYWQKQTEKLLGS